MSIFDEPKGDCHNHVFDPARFACAGDLNRGTDFSATLRGVALAPRNRPLRRAVEHVLPDASECRQPMWETPLKLFGFAA